MSRNIRRLSSRTDNSLTLNDWNSNSTSHFYTTPNEHLDGAAEDVKNVLRCCSKMEVENKRDWRSIQRRIMYRIFRLVSDFVSHFFDSFPLSTRQRRHQHRLMLWHEETYLQSWLKSEHFPSFVFDSHLKCRRGVVDLHPQSPPYLLIPHQLAAAASVSSSSLKFSFSVSTASRNICFVTEMWKYSFSLS